MTRENWQGRCWSCGQTLKAADFSREDRCPDCSKATHACKNCRYYKPGLANDCREPVAERVTDKERSNFCDYFEPWEAAYGGATATPGDDMLSAAEDLFK